MMEWVSKKVISVPMIIAKARANQSQWSCDPNANRIVTVHAICYVFVSLWTTSFHSVLSPIISIPFPLSLADYIGLPRPYLLSLITPIVDPPLHYLVALCLSPYPHLPSYHVWYIGPQSGGTVGLGLCPLCSLILTRSRSTSSI